MTAVTAVTAVTPAVAAEVGGVAVTVLGQGAPVTLFAHGLGGTSAETHPLAQRVAGTRVLMDFRGHGRSEPLPDGWDYDLLAADLLRVADEVGACGAVGLSLGAGALLRLLTREPGRFRRVAFLLPAALDRTRRDGATEQLEELGAAIDAGDEQAVCALLLADLPEHVRVRPGAALLLSRRARLLVRRPAPYPRRDERPLRALGQLDGIDVPALVVGQEDDALHPVAIARTLAEALPAGELLVLPPGGVFWTATRRVQDALATHLAV